MKYTVVSSVEFTYPDVWDYSTSAQEINTFCARGGYASFQVLFEKPLLDSTEISFENLPDGTNAEVYTLMPIFVEENRPNDPDCKELGTIAKKAPFYVFDCLKEFDGSLDFSKGFGGVYVSIKTSKTAPAGNYTCKMVVNGEKINLNLKIYNAVLPNESLKMINHLSETAIVKYHNVEKKSPEYYALEEKYLKQLRRLHQNMMYTHGVKITNLGNNKWDFDFTDFINQVKRFEKAGMKYFYAPAIAFRKSWTAPDIIINGCGLEATSFEGYCYLSQYLPKLRQVILENNWIDKFYIGVCDEPNSQNSMPFRALCGIVRKLFPEIRLMDATGYSAIYGALDVVIPVNRLYDKYRNQLEALRMDGTEIWHYVCCVPRGDNYINRFMDTPLLSTRYLHWGNFKYNLTGYLHWAVNSYQPNQNPFTQNCPEHHNADSVSFLPAGDTHIIYPGENAPWMSIRLETQRESAEEYELLKLLSQTNPEKANQLCERVFHSFCDVEYNPNIFIQTQKELLEALS